MAMDYLSNQFPDDFPKDKEPPKPKPKPLTKLKKLPRIRKKPSLIHNKFSLMQQIMRMRKRRRRKRKNCLHNLPFRLLVWTLMSRIRRHQRRNTHYMNP